MKKYLRTTLAVMTALTAFSAFAENQSKPLGMQQVETPTVATEQTSVKHINLVNLNTASAAEIQDKLVGIGAKKAQAIVEYREKHGKFISLEQLTEVSGIGKATLDKNRDRLVLE